MSGTLVAGPTVLRPVEAASHAMRGPGAAERHPLMRGSTGAGSDPAIASKPEDTASTTAEGRIPAGGDSERSGTGPVRQRVFSGAPCGGDLLNPVALHSALIEAYLHLCGLQPCVVQVDAETHVHCWRTAPPTRPPSFFCGPRGNESRPGTSRQQTVLLLHGFGASAMWQWLHQVRALGSAGFNVVMPDLVFFGGSWSSSAERSIGFQANAMSLLMQHLGKDTFHVCGISYGGFVAYRSAAGQ